MKYDAGDQFTILILGEIKWEIIRGWGIVDNNLKVIVGVQTSQMCKELCLAETEFTCASIEYGHRTANKECHLQSVVKGQQLFQQ